MGRLVGKLVSGHDLVFLMLTCYKLVAC